LLPEKNILTEFFMDKVTSTQVSIVSFIVGMIMLFIPYLKNFDSVIPGISQYFSLMFYLGLLLVIVGYYLK
jgi:drug/metabolite transporter (DMT)-like permease